MSRDLSLGMNHLFTLYENEKDFEQQQFNRNHNQNTTASGPAFDSTEGFQTGLNQSEFAFSALGEPFQTSFSSAVEDPSSANSAFRFSDLSYDNDYDPAVFPGNNLEQLYRLDTSFHNIQGNPFNPNQQQYSGTTSPPIWPSMMGNANHESRNQIQYTMPLSNQAPQISIPPLKVLGNDSTSNTRSQQSSAPISAISNNGQMEQSRNLYSKHISNVMSHFTSSKEGISKLLNEIDDFVHVVSSSGGIHFASSSVIRLLEQSQDAIIGKSLFDLLHQNDRDTAKTYIEQAISSNSDFIMYIRYISLHGSVKLCEVKGKPYFAIESESSPMAQGQMMVILSAREYSSKGMQSLDAIVELQIETLQLKRRLEEVLMQKGLDPSTHFLLSHNQSEVTVQDDSNQVDDFTESFLFTLEGQSIKGSLFEAPTIDSMDHYTMLQPSANPGQPPNSSFIGKSVVANTQGAAPAVTAAPEKKTRKRKAIHTDMFCLQCGTTKSPEWRAGPEGPKTLCNACGLAYYKKNKKLSEEKKKLAAAAVVARSNPVPTI